MFMTQTNLKAYPMANALLLVSLLSVMLAFSRPSAASATSIGQIIFAVGDVALERQQKQLTVERGLAVYVGDTLISGADGHVHLLMYDKGFFSIRPNSRMTLDAYHYDAKNSQNSQVKVKLDSGVMRSITGRAGETHKEGYRVNTPVAAIGVRGTDYTLMTTESLSRLSVRSGGVVMSPFGDSCSANNSGPCGGAGAAELFARDKGAVLEARLNSDNAVINYNAPSPDEISPPLPEEQHLFNQLTESIQLRVSSSTDTDVKRQEQSGTDTHTSSQESESNTATEPSDSTARNDAVDDQHGNENESNESESSESNVANTTEASADSTEDSQATDETVDVTSGPEYTDSDSNVTQSDETRSTNTLKESAETDSDNEVIDYISRRQTFERYFEQQPLAKLAKEVGSQGGGIILPNNAGLVEKPSIIWGRWDEYRGADESYQRISSLLHENRQYATFNSVFAMLADEVDSRDIPESGRTFFKLNSYEAYVKRGASLEAAGLSNASLLIDFDESRFATFMNFHAASLAEVVEITGSGVVTNTGFFSSDGDSPSTVNGVFSPQAGEAGFLFETNLAPGVDATGATHWINTDR